MDLFVWTLDHWLAVTLATLAATVIVAIVRLVRYCPTIDDDSEL